MLTSRLDLLVLNHHSDASGPVYLTAPDAAVYVERPPVPTPQELDDAMSATFLPDLLLAHVVTTFERLRTLALAPGDAQEILRLIGPDRDLGNDQQFQAYRDAVDAGRPVPDGIPTAQVLVRRGALREFVAQRLGADLIARVEQWSDTSPEGLAVLQRLLIEVEPRTSYGAQR